MNRLDDECLYSFQYTIGIRGWKQWIIQKNEQIEQAAAAANKKAKTFNLNILKLTTDELNYLLCRFVREIRKPNGTEYAPDTIYYLCLSIQQYLSENGRVDNIFTDPLYDQFTDALDEEAVKFSEINESTRKPAKFTVETIIINLVIYLIHCS